MPNSYGRYNEITETTGFQKDYMSFYAQHPNMEDWRASVEFILSRDPKTGKSHELQNGFRILVVDPTEPIPEIAVLYRFNEKDERDAIVHLWAMEAL